jgi:hypothetical protein
MIPSMQTRLPLSADCWPPGEGVPSGNRQTGRPHGGALDGNGAWIVSTHPARLFSRNQAMTALTVAE